MIVEATSSSQRERLVSAGAVAAFHLVLGYALLSASGSALLERDPNSLALFDVVEERPPPVTQPPAPAPEKRPEGASAPPALEAEASPVIAPVPLIQLDIPPPLVAAPVVAIGSETTLGSALIDGPGTGSGGEGIGRGAGSGGSGTGSGDASLPPVRTRRISGYFTTRDYPKLAEQAGAQGVVAARLTVGKKGRVTDCRIRLSSGNAALDGTTCRIILKRFRFLPARDAAGKPTTDLVEWEQTWSLRPEDRPELAEAQCRSRADGLPEPAARRTEFLSCMASFGWRR